MPRELKSRPSTSPIHHGRLILDEIVKEKSEDLCTSTFGEMIDEEGAAFQKYLSAEKLEPVLWERLKPRFVEKIAKLNVFKQARVNWETDETLLAAVRNSFAVGLHSSWSRLSETHRPPQDQIK